jgi:type II secretory pathway component GspD/PulD (secretin)
MEIEMSIEGTGKRLRNSAQLLLLTLFCIGMIAGVPAQETVLEVIDLKYRSADQIVPMLKPLLAPGGTISSLQNRVIVRTTPQNLAELRKVLDAVDNKPKRLVISVRQEMAQASAASGAEVSGSIGTEGVRVTIPRSRKKQGATGEVRKGDDVARAQVFSSQSSATNNGVQTVQVLEGNEALISVGQSVPVRSRSVTRSPQGTQTSESVEYRDADTGFRVRPRLHGDQVTLEISTRNDALANPGSQTLNIQRVDTVVTGRLGAWMEFGGIDQSRTQTENSTLSRRSGSASDERKVFLKVDLLP